MSLPSQEILDDIRELITEITGFKETDENFRICDRYCLSHVVHHTYPFVNRTTVKNLVNSYVSRFYGHGYFKVSQELNYQVKKFLSNEKLFQKNPQYDIQWCLLSLLSSLSSNLTSVKEIPDLLPTDEEENETDDINWGEYLTKDLPQKYPPVLSSDSDDSTKDKDDQEDSEEEQDEDNLKINDSKSLKKETMKNPYQITQPVEILHVNSNLLNSEKESEMRRKRFREFLQKRRLTKSIENDFHLRGNISEKFDILMNREGIYRKSQLLSEYEVMENILHQFQTGERTLLKKGFVSPALTSVTQVTLSNYLESLQPYFRIIRDFKDFDAEVTEWKYPEKAKDKGLLCSKGIHTMPTLSISNNKKPKIPGVVYVYNEMLKKALEPFYNEVAEMANNCKLKSNTKQDIDIIKFLIKKTKEMRCLLQEEIFPNSVENYTLIKLEHKLKSRFFDLTSLHNCHSLATKNWKKDPNWMLSIRILSVLYNATMDATSCRMSFVYLNLFLHCFQVYLNLMDLWISSLDLVDPTEEFIVVKCNNSSTTDGGCDEFQIHPYKIEMENSHIKEVPVLDFIGEKMVLVGQSLEVLRRLNRFVNHKGDSPNSSTFESLIKLINDKIASLEKEKVEVEKPKKEERQRSIFTMKNPLSILPKDDGGGDSIASILLMELKKEEEEMKAEKETTKQKAFEGEVTEKSCREFIYSNINNQYFKMAFENVGVKEVQRKLEQIRKEEEKKEDDFMVVRKKDEKKNAVYPFHKIISESFYQVFGSRVSDACTLVKNYIIKECDLPSHFALLRSVLLFHDAYLIQSFMLAFFTQPVIWGSSFSLSLHLKECMKSLYKNLSDGLSITLAKSNVLKYENVLQAIDAISVNYEVKWPMTLIFTPDVMEKYNKIFRLALKLKWSHWALTGLHFQKKDEPQPVVSKATRHRVQLLRFWFLSVLNRINNYFMAMMLPWDFDLASCKNLKDIISVHANLLDKICDNCLLSDKHVEERGLIFQTFVPLCMDLWANENVMTEEKLTVIENIFANCQLRLSKLLSSLEKY